MKYFISHSSKDIDSVEVLVRTIEDYEKDTGEQKCVFCSSIPENGSDFKEELITNINNNISLAENIILVITENYLRSSFCFYEMSLARYMKAANKKIILIIKDDSIATRIDDIFPAKTFLHINAMLDDAANTLANSLGYTGDVIMQLDLFFDALRKGQTMLTKPYIGMLPTEYELKYKFIEKYGVKKIGFNYPTTPETAQEMLKDAVEIYFVSTTGSGFLKTYKEVLSGCVARGCDLSLVISDKNSQFSTDVADIEAFDSEAGYEQLKNNNKSRIESEFHATFQYLNEIFASAKRSSHTQGVIRCSSSYTLIRQTAFIAKKSNGNYWGWITCTMPPVRSADSTPSIVFEGDSDNVLANDVWKYATSMLRLAEQRGGMFEIDGIDLPEKLDVSSEGKGFEECLERSKAYWIAQYQKAQRNMADREGLFDRILIEVAAQHPLKNLKVPNKEFQARLDKAVELYNKYTDDGIEVMIYVPGSRHMFNGIADEVSLSDAGVKYLLDKGICAEHLLGEKENDLYKGEHGVYNSADECYVASEIFKNGPFEKIICVCSPNQIARKTMLYIEFGCVPLCYGVTTDKMYHQNIVDEIFNSLNRVLYIDHSWQDENSEWFKYFRDTRRPK